MEKVVQQPSLRFYPLKEDSDYLIYENGQLYSKKANRFLKGKIDNVGYQVYALAIGDKFSVNNKRKSKMLYAHRLVAEYFIPNPLNLPYVHHKDGNRLNNNVNNLDWTTAAENNLYKINKGNRSTTPKYKLVDLEGEEWRQIPFNVKYSISNMGRVVNNTNNRLLSIDNSQKYCRIAFSPNRTKHYYIHRLVYCIFNNDYDLEGFVIDHIDNNPKNNQLSNLQKITQSENCLKQKRYS